MRLVPLERPPRAPAGAVTDAVRRSILRQADERVGLTAPTILHLHTELEHLADTRDLFADVERRYQLPLGSLHKRVATRILDAQVLAAASYGPSVQAVVHTDGGAQFILLELPETEFLTAIEHAVIAMLEYGRVERPAVKHFLQSTEGALRTHGVPYRCVRNSCRFEWVGDPKQHEVTVQPALLALADSRLAGPRAEFEEALGKRRGGTPKDLEDAVDEAAKSVESILKVLHDERSLVRPSNEVVSQLFKSLKDAQVLPHYVSNLVTAAASPRNNMASHGQGATVREVPEELADASIAAAATAITFLAHYLS